MVGIIAAMLFLLSPAKSLDYETPLAASAATPPVFADQSAQLIRTLRRKSVRQVAALAAARGWRIGNLDVTVIAEAPKLAPHVPAMRANLAADLACGIGDVSVKATTTERLGFAGRGEGIAALATVLLLRD